MLDATHGTATCTATDEQRAHGRSVEVQMVGIGTRNRTTPSVTVRTRGAKRTGRLITEA
jgi:hypothetical protein